MDLVESTRRVALPRRKKSRRAVLIGTSTTMLVACGTAVAAATIGGWHAPWADRPLGSITFELPSGGQCEQRIGDLHVGNAKAQSIVQSWLSGHPLSQVVDADASLRTIRSSKQMWDKDGIEIPVGYGTKHYDADYEYVDAVMQALSGAINAKLAEEGFATYVPVTWGGELRCSGSNPTPSVPEWLK
ncbi:MAG: hypothetical protein JWR52_1784 [Marmoricola sp.]|nr:hypothetical protein [Marmoricola sp.]